MTRRPQHLGIVALAAATVAVVALTAPPPALAGEPMPRQAVATPGAGPTIAVRPVASHPDQSLSLDRSSKVFAATGYQTLTLVGLVGGAAAIGALAGGISGALTAGGAVLIGYVLMR